MFFLDRMRDKDGGDIYRTKTNFRYPLQKDRQGNYKVKSGEMRVLSLFDTNVPMQ